MNLIVFLITAVAVSLSGVIMPGPLFAATIVKGYDDRNAGLPIAVGHGIIEFPLMFLIYFGFAQIVSGMVLKGVGIVGGAVLIYMSVQMLRSGGKKSEGKTDIGYGSLTAGIAATGGNPYFFLWWATVGSALIIRSFPFGLHGFLLFCVVHWLCDFSWYLLVSRVVFGSKRFWTENVRKAVFTACGLIMAGFGAWILLSGLGIIGA